MDVLKELPGYSTASVLYLSPTDSIIEALQCALELNVPVYGVDVEQATEAQRPRVMLQDPTLAIGKVAQYVGRNARYAENQRDDEIDLAREFVMAARLKRVLQRHKRVLFTGGLAHWRSIEQLLHDPNCPPAQAQEPGHVNADDFARVVVHPLLAIHHMDLFPALAERYQSRRLPADRHRRWIREDELDASRAFAELLSATYGEYFKLEGPEQQLDRRLEDLHARCGFEQLLSNLCTVKQQLVPDVFAAMEAAQGVMTPQFCRTLANTLMKFNWVKPDDFPDLPILAPVPNQSGPCLRVEYRDGQGNHGEPFYVTPLPEGEDYSSHVNIPWAEPPRLEYGLVQESHHERGWPPWNHIYIGLSTRAFEIGTGERKDQRIQAFEGSLLNGLAVKDTLRAHIRGDDRIYVRDLPRRTEPGHKEADTWHPIVWIFRLGRPEGSDWFVSMTSHDMYREHVRDQERRAFAAGVPEPRPGVC